METLNKPQVLEIFKSDALMAIKRMEKDSFSGRRDTAMRSLEWGFLTDRLCKEGKITTNQYNNWVLPNCCK